MEASLPSIKAPPRLATQICITPMRTKADLLSVTPGSSILEMLLMEVGVSSDVMEFPEMELVAPIESTCIRLLFWVRVLRAPFTSERIDSIDPSMREAAILLSARFLHGPSAPMRFLVKMIMCAAVACAMGTCMRQQPARILWSHKQQGHLPLNMYRAV